MTFTSRADPAACLCAGCGQERDLSQYAALFNATGKSILIENCHWGGTVPNATWCVSPRDGERVRVTGTTVRSLTKLPTPLSRPRRCPWNYFRSSGDIRASYDAVVSNLQTTIQWAKSGLSEPVSSEAHLQPPASA